MKSQNHKIIITKSQNYNHKITKSQNYSHKITKLIWNKNDFLKRN